MSADPRRAIPGVDRLLADPGAGPLLDRYPRERVSEALRRAVAEVRDRLATGHAGPATTPDAADPAPYLALAAEWLELDAAPSLRRVVNATGVVLHTNLGRAPLAAEARDALLDATPGYTNLEFDLDRGVRGSRYEHCAALLAESTGAEGALVVNNCAAALVLAVNTLAAGCAVVVSRGELVEIGGGFRIPDMLSRAGARLVEVGTTNRTRASDYREALTREDVGLLLKVHRSNFRVAGFTEEATLGELVELGREFDVPVVHDVGSGLLVDPAALDLPDEPTASRSIAQGVALAVFSGDKLLGGPQAGCMVGAADLVARLRGNPLCRALRVDKGTLAALEATLRLYRDPDTVRLRVPTLAMLVTPIDELEERARAVVEALREPLGERGLDVDAAPSEAVVGGGTYPGHRMASWAVVIGPRDEALEALSAESLAERLRRGAGGVPPVVGRVDEGRLLLDLRTVQPSEDAWLVTALLAAVGAVPERR